MGHKIKEIRKQRGITQEELAKRSGVSRTTISLLEKNNCAITTTKTLYRIAKALNVSISQIFFEDFV